MKTWVGVPIDELPLRTHTKNVLRGMGLLFGDDLYPLTVIDFLRVRHLGHSTLKDIRTLHACPAIEEHFKNP